MQRRFLNNIINEPDNKAYLAPIEKNIYRILV
jgi:hypothetical protein